MNSKTDFSIIIKKLRKAAGLSQQEFSKILNKDQATISRFEKGTQSPNLETIFNIAKFFDINQQDFLMGHADIISVAKRFGETPSINPKYLSNQNSILRESLPLLNFVSSKKDLKTLEKLLNSLGLIDLPFMSPNTQVSSLIYFDLLERAIESKILDESNIEDLVHLTQSVEYHGELYSVYKSQNNPFDVIRAYVLNSCVYEGSFKSRVSDQKENSMSLLYELRPELKDKKYSKNNLSEFILTLKEVQIAELIKFFSKKTALTKVKLIITGDFYSGFELNIKLL